MSNAVAPGCLAAALSLSVAACQGSAEQSSPHCEPEGPQSANYGFFLFGDAHFGPPANNASNQRAMAQMRLIDPAAVAAFSNGDLVDSDSEAQWGMHDAGIAVGSFNAAGGCSGSFGVGANYFGALGDHDVFDGHWLELWNRHFGAQRELGPDSQDGIYYAQSYANALFVVLDSEHVSSERTSFSDEQSRWLESVLASSSAQLKFVFFHQAAYSCSGHHSPFAAALPWLALAEQYEVNLVVGSHTHVYTRSCPRLGGACTGDNSGVVFLETGPLGGVPRDIDVTTATVTGTDATGAERSDSYDCVVGQGLAAARGSLNDFCHVRVEGCSATVSCYVVGEGNTTPFDSWTIDGCN